MDERSFKFEFELSEIRNSLEVLDSVLTYAYEGYVLVDKDARIIKMNYEKLMGIKEEAVLGKPVEEIIENSRLHIVVKTGVNEIGYVQRIQGHDMITNRIPIFKEGKIIGALGTIVFKDIIDIKERSRELILLQNKINGYKGELERIEGTLYSFDSIVTQDGKMEYLKNLGKKAALTNSTVLITGESGTGKELFANGIHKASYRRSKEFIAINCAAIPKELLETELFGYEEGAFTGAKKGGKLGKFEIAKGGTIFLDEIGTMPMEMQVKLLRVLEAKEFERVGGNKKIELDARIIAATNENIEEQIRSGKFREDLYYRLNVISLDIPPLKDRLEDIPLLAESLLTYLTKEMRIEKKILAKETIKILKTYDWPGNVRELRNVLERVLNISSSNIIYPEHLPERVINRVNYSIENHEIRPLNEIVYEAEKEAIKKALIVCNGNKSLAADRLGIHRTALYKKISKHNLQD